MTWHRAFIMIPINIGQFQIKYRSVAVQSEIFPLWSNSFLVEVWVIYWLGDHYEGG